MANNTAGIPQVRVQEAVDRLVADGGEVGLQVAVIHRGDLVVDAVAGSADARRGLPVTSDTLFFATSTAKGVASAVAHVLVERGELTYDLRVADVWPEFSAHGKGDVTLRHVLMHTAGVPGLPHATTVEELCDWDLMCRTVADAEPWWEPGTRFGYHVHTFGFLLGETVRRATGRTLTWWLHEAVTGPLGVEDDVHFGVPPVLLDRVARQEAVPGARPHHLDPGTPAGRAVPPATRPTADLANRRDVLTSDLVAQGTMTARGIARVYTGLLGYADVSLVSPDRLTDLALPAYAGPDEVMGIPATTWAFGFSDYRPGDVTARPGSTFGMAGGNGCAAWADIDSGLAVAVMRNRFSPDWSAAGEIDRIVTDQFSTRQLGAGS
ncbi:serine hydrolase domain-containing protein [Promicromonospora iranensis]|uniref:serine hydrolase domain-containing protein n=1 Tax=Promicromonospora iranensis TaxID=1105144 RepID=UPI0023A977C5|nr:serine hydrolase domain-containing protein [Promicromonospora iranensis]